MVSTNLAARLLAFSPSAEVTDALLPHVELGGAPVQIGSTPSPAVGTRNAKRSVGYAATIAATATDPQLLASLAKMTQKTVRRLVAANPATPLETLESLRDWALNADSRDDDTLTALYSTMPPPQYLPWLPGRYRWEDKSKNQDACHFAPGDVVADQLARRQDLRMVWDTYRLALAPVNRSIVNRAVTGKLPVSAAALLLETEPTQLDSMLDGVLSADGAVLDDQVVNLVVARFTSAEPVPPRYQERAARMRALSAYGVEQFVRSGVEVLTRSVAWSVANRQATIDTNLLAELAAGATGATVTVLLSRTELRDRLTLEQLDSLALRMTTEHADAVRELLTCYGRQLTSPARVNLLRHASRTVTDEWITGDLNVAPTVAELEALVTEPGLSLTLRRDLPYELPRRDKAPTSVGEMVALFGDLFTVEVATRPELGPVLNAAGTTTLKRAVYAGNYDTAYADHDGHRHHGSSFAAPSGFTAYLAGRVHARFGANPEAWLAVAKMAETMLVGTVDDFLTLVAAMHGLHEREDSPAAGSTAGGTVDLPNEPAAVDVVEADTFVVVDADALQPMLC